MIARVSYLSDTGLRRSENEDSLVVGGQVIAGEDIERHVAELNLPTLLAVADGLGGHSMGAEASAIAARVAATTDAARASKRYASTLLKDILKKIRHLAAELSVGEPGTTLCGAWLTSDRIAMFNCGDSRCYTMFQGELRQVSTDHSHVQHLFEQGEITREEMRTHIGRNILTSAIIGGSSSPRPKLDYVEILPAECEKLFFCTDGVTEHCDDDQLQRALSMEHGDASEMIRNWCIEGGARDNFTFAIAELLMQ